MENAFITHTVVTTIGVLLVTTVNFAEEHGEILPEPADETKKKRKNEQGSRNSRATGVGGGVLMVILCSVPGSNLWSILHENLGYYLWAKPLQEEKTCEIKKINKKDELVHFWCTLE